MRSWFACQFCEREEVVVEEEEVEEKIPSEWIH